MMKLTTFRYIKNEVRKLCKYVSADFLANSRRSKILMFHGVWYRKFYGVQQQAIIPLDVFYAKIKYLHENYKIVSLDEFLENKNKGGYEKNKIVLTFDDGYLNICSIIYPMLKYLNIPFVLYIVPSYAGTDKLLWWDELGIRIMNYSGEINTSIGNFNIDANSQRDVLLTLIDLLKVLDYATLNQTLNEIKEICPFPLDVDQELLDSVKVANWSDLEKLSKDQNVTIGAHTIDHVVLHGKQRYETIESQIKESKRIIEEQLGIECKHFSYPNGSLKNDICQYAIDMVKTAGFSSAVTTTSDYQNFSDPFILPRWDASFGRSVADFRYKLRL